MLQIKAPRIVEAKKCILLGYGKTTKGYRLYDPATDKVFYCRDVKFNEPEKDDGELLFLKPHQE